MSIENLKILLNQVKILNDSFERVKILTGESYNIFKLLNVEHSELLHSKIIGDFLNPNGSHKQGSIFLELFLEIIKNKSEHKLELDCSKSFVKLEKSIGESGQLDIFVSDKKNALIIENKIYAGEQPDQLERYNTYGINLKGSYLLLFLTLNGHKPTSILQENSNKLVCISYEKDIINWLELCKKEVINLPIIRESITQYINLLKKLTNQTENQKQAMEIQTLILANIESASEINKNYNDAILFFARNVKEITEDKLKKYLEENHHNKWKIEFTDKFGTIWINPINEENKYGFGIEHFKTQFINHFHSGALFYGIKTDDRNSRNLQIEPKINNNFWLSWFKIEHKGIEINFSNPVDLLKTKLSEKEIAEDVAEEIVEKFKVYFDENQEKILNLY